MCVYQAKVSFLVKTKHIISLSTIQKVVSFSISISCSDSWHLLSSSSSKNIVISICSLVFHVFIFRVYLTLVKAVTLILKHATFLCTSMSSKSAVNQAEQKYHKAKIDVTIQEHLTACAGQQSEEQFVNFIMSTDISLFIFFYLSHQYLIILSVSSHSSGHTGA